MKIKDLSEELRELALKRQMEQSNIMDPETSLMCAFNWGRTPEKETFWVNVDGGKDVSSHPLYPIPKYNIFN